MKPTKRQPASNGPASSSYHWIVLPNTGMQICRGFPIAGAVAQTAGQVFEAAAKLAAKQTDSEALDLIQEHIACNQELDATPWIQCDPNEFVFYRLRRAGGELQLDLVLDTCNGAGAQAGNRIPLRVDQQRFALRKPEPLAEIYVEHHRNARNEIGSLIVDFGNTGSAFVFSRDGAGPLQARIVEANNPFDPDYRNRKDTERHVLRSNMIVLRVSPNEHETPWIVLGQRAEELIRSHPLTSYLYAPKKYVRDWPEAQRAPEPTMKFRGISGQRVGLHPMLHFVRTTRGPDVPARPGLADQPAVHLRRARLLPADHAGHADLPADLAGGRSPTVPRDGPRDVDAAAGPRGSGASSSRSS